jgi:hypothetical protein
MFGGCDFCSIEVYCGSKLYLVPESKPSLSDVVLGIHIRLQPHRGTLSLAERFFAPQMRNKLVSVQLHGHCEHREDIYAAANSRAQHDAYGIDMEEVDPRFDTDFVGGWASVEHPDLQANTPLQALAVSKMNMDTELTA